MKEIFHILDLLNDRLRVIESKNKTNDSGWRETRDAIQACRDRLTQGVSTT